MSSIKTIAIIFFFFFFFFFAENRLGAERVKMLLPVTLSGPSRVLFIITAKRQAPRE